MKISDLRPCFFCSGNIVPLFYLVRISAAIVLPKAAHRVVELTEIMGGMANTSALHVAESLAPDADCVKILGDEERDLMTQLCICQECFTTKALCLATLMDPGAEKRTEDAST
jgi:hypothetical protein